MQCLIARTCQKLQTWCQLLILFVGLARQRQPVAQDGA